jgi:adenosylcobyric acid synthase
MTPVLMIQGTASHAGKTTLVAALCRLFADAGLRVAPFKAQNMSLNAAVTPDGGEIGRAQMLQAIAARATPDVRMNPVLLKPEADARSQLVVMGRARTVESAREYYARVETLWPIVTQALDGLRRDYDLVIAEGAGSPAEINLHDRDIVNMRVARYASAPVILVGDIERGGVFASLVGTLALLPPAERALVRGFVINKFRGDPRLLDPGPAMLEERTGVPTLGVLPYAHDILLPEEDALGLPLTTPPAVESAMIDVAVIRLPHIANFDDVDPLRREPDVHVRFVDSPTDLGRPDLIIVPGSKTTIADLEWMRHRALDRAITHARAAGTPVLGICGGYQMLGAWIHDPDHVESRTTSVRGLALLPTVTTFATTKTTLQVEGTMLTPPGLLAPCAHAPITGYEIHAGTTRPATPAELPTAAPPLPTTPAIRITRRSSIPTNDLDGTVDADGLTWGTYVHGLLESPSLRHALLTALRAARGKDRDTPSSAAQPYSLDTELDRLATHVRTHVNWPAIEALVHAQR